MTKAIDRGSITDLLSAKMIMHYQENPVDFVEDIIFHKNFKGVGGEFYVTDQQKEIMDAIAHNRRTSVSAGRGIGKSSVLAWTIIWWHSCFPRARSVAFAPAYPQLKSVLWPEIAKWVGTSLVAKYFEHTERKFYLIEDAKVNFSEPRSAAKEEAAQGLHEDHLLIMIDEASGVEDKIYERLSGSLTKPNNKMVLMSNPTRTSGFFFDSHHRVKRHWETFMFDSQESPLVDIEFLDQMRDRYVTPTFIHDMFRVHVMGQFPTGDPESFIKLTDIYDAVLRTVNHKDQNVEIGVDVARKGNDMTAISVRQGWHVFSGEELGFYKDSGDKETKHIITMGQSTKINEIVDFVIRVVKRVREELDYDDLIRIKVDDSGVGGGVTDYLELDTENNIEVVPIVFSTKRSEKYADVPSKMWGNIRENIEKISLPNDVQLIEELSSRRWAEDRGLIKIEPKSKYKKDFGASPDKADSLILAFADLENEKRIVKGYDYREPILIGVPAAALQHGFKYMCVYSIPGQKTSAVWVTWSGGAIRVVDEFVGDTADIVEIARLNGFNKALGNPAMFKIGDNDLSLFFMDNGVWIQEAYGYNELSAVNSLATIGKQGRLIVAEECTQTNNQLRTWTDRTDKEFGKERYGLCYALTLVVFELVENKELTFHNSPILVDHFENSDVNSGFMSV